jgi:hypothetical protein
LRTPLHGILGYAGLLLLEGGLTRPQSERLESMMAAGQYLMSTINAVLDVSPTPGRAFGPDIVTSCSRHSNGSTPTP